MHIVTGSAVSVAENIYSHVITIHTQGCREDHSKFQKHQPEWVAFKSVDYGYSVYNATHLNLEQISADQVRANSFWTQILCF